MFTKKTTLPTRGSSTTFIGHGMRIDGKVRCLGSIRIDGEIHGDIDCQNEVAVGPTAYIVATIHALRIVVNGRVEGNLYASDQLEVLAEGYIVGNVSNPAGKLIIHEGAVIEGQCLTYEAPTETKVITLTPDTKLLDSKKDGERSSYKQNYK